MPSAFDMADSAADQAGFARGLIDADKPTPAGLTGPGAKKANRRYDVYRNNVTVSLVSALAEIFPATCRIVGEDFFRAMARAYVAEEPPTSRLLFEYGHTFPDFVARFPPAARLVYLPDVASLERLWLNMFHAADASPMTPETLAAVSADDLPALRFEPHPAAAILRSDYAVVSIFAANRSDGAPAQPIRALDPEDALVSRPDIHVDTRLLAPGEAVFLQSLMAGSTFGAAAEEAGAVAGFDLPRAVSTLLSAGLFTGISTAQT